MVNLEINDSESDLISFSLENTLKITRTFLANFKGADKEQFMAMKILQFQCENLADKVKKKK